MAGSWWISRRVDLGNPAFIDDIRISLGGGSWVRDYVFVARVLVLMEKLEYSTNIILGRFFHTKFFI